MFLITQDNHKVYYDTHGNKQGIPVLVIHGGPGAGCSHAMLEFFDLSKYFVILVDQRGSGKSLPYASLKNNTTQDLIKDFEAIRTQLKIDQWILFGGSWGSTLALTYAIYYPSVPIALILRGVFLARTSETAWLMQNGASNLNPHAWQEFIQEIPLEEQFNILSHYYKKLTSSDLKTQQKWAIKMAKWEASISYLKHNKAAIHAFIEPKFSLALARIEVHYLYNNCFIPENYILNNVNILKNIPIHIVQGAYDLVCPAKSAYDLQKATNASLVITHAGHSASETETKQQLKSILQGFT